MPQTAAKHDNHAIIHDAVLRTDATMRIFFSGQTMIFL